jgi:hypothetical protein
MQVVVSWFDELRRKARRRAGGNRSFGAATCALTA